MTYEIPKEDWQKCEICNLSLREIKKSIGGKNIYFSQAFIKHIENAHSISIEDYFKTYKNIEQPECVCKQCKKKVLIRKSTSSKIQWRKYACGRFDGCENAWERLSQERQGSGNPMYNATPWNKDKNKYNNETIRGISKKLIGRTVSVSARKQMSVSAKKRTVHGHAGHQHSQESKQKMRDATLNNIKKGVFNQNETKPVKIFKGLLVKNNIRFEREKILHYWSIDFYLIDYNCYIEIDGDYWHSNPNIYMNGPQTKSQIINYHNDTRKNTFCKNHNINLIRFWESDILNDIKDIECRLNQLLTSNMLGK